VLAWTAEALVTLALGLALALGLTVAALGSSSSSVTGSSGLTAAAFLLRAFLPTGAGVPALTAEALQASLVGSQARPPLQLPGPRTHHILTRSLWKAVSAEVLVPGQPHIQLPGPRTKVAQEDVQR